MLSTTRAATPTRSGASILDSPADTAHASTDTTTAWKQLVSACLQQTTCRHRFPQVANLWARAANRVERTPVVLHGSGPIAPETVARLVRSVLSGPGPSTPGELLAMLKAIAAGRLDANARASLAGDAAACLGYRPVCSDLHDFALGFFLTQACPSLGSPPTVAGTVLGLTAFGADDPYRAACSSWPRVTAHSDVANVPTLVLAGRLDPMTTQRMPAGGDHWYQVDFANQTHNILGYVACGISMRNDWVDRVQKAPDTACTKNVPDAQFPNSAR